LHNICYEVEIKKQSIDISQKCATTST